MRECPKCGIRFFKEEGCNRMTCSCGQVMCYQCRKPITGYEHFQSGGCVLHTNSKAEDELAVAKAGEEAARLLAPKLQTLGASSLKLPGATKTIQKPSSIPATPKTAQPGLVYKPPVGLGNPVAPAYHAPKRNPAPPAPPAPPTRKPVTLPAAPSRTAVPQTAQAAEGLFISDNSRLERLLASVNDQVLRFREAHRRQDGKR